MWIKRHFPVALLLLACLFVSCAAAKAQDRPKGELFVGFSGRTNGDPILKGWNASAAIHINEQLAIVADFSGHYGSQSTTQVVYSFANFLQGTPSSSLPTLPRSSSETNVNSFLFGPQFSHRINSRARVFVRSLFGATRVNANQNSQLIGSFLTIQPGGTASPAQPSQPAFATKTPPCNVISFNSGITPSGLVNFGGSRVCETTVGFSFGAGGGLDVTVAKHWAVRVFQADYLNKPNVLGRGSNDFRLSSGLLYQW